MKQLQVLCFVLAVFSILSGRGNATTIVDIDLSTTNTIVLEVPTLQEIDQNYQDQGIYLDPATRQTILELDRQESWMGQITNTYLRDSYQTAVQNGQAFLTQQEFEDDSWQSVEIGVNFLKQDLITKRPLLVDYLASGQTPSVFYNNRADVRQAFVILEGFVDFTSMFSSETTLTNYINTLPTTAIQAYNSIECRSAFELPLFIEHWTLDRLTTLNPSVSQAVDASSMREDLIAEASRRFVLQDHSGDITFQDSTKQPIWDGFVSELENLSPTPPLDQIFN
jgi:hypothetical protein